MMISRRSLLRMVLPLIAAPAIVRASSLMPVASLPLDRAPWSTSGFKVYWLDGVPARLDLEAIRRVSAELARAYDDATRSMRTLLPNEDWSRRSMREQPLLAPAGPEEVDTP